MATSYLKRTLISCSLGLGILLAPAAHAGLLGNGYAAGSQQFNLLSAGQTNAGGFTGTWDGDPLIFWCVELSETFSFGTTYPYGASLPDTPIFTLLGKLFNNAFGSALSDAAHSAAFQLAVWEIFFDSGDLRLDNGVFQVVGTNGNNDAVTFAQQWLDGLASPSSIDNVNVFYLVNDGHQNFITNSSSLRVTTQQVPEPSSILLIALALGAATVIGRRRFRRTAQG